LDNAREQDGKIIVVRALSYREGKEMKGRLQVQEGSGGKLLNGATFKSRTGGKNLSFTAENYRGGFAYLKKGAL